MTSSNPHTTLIVGGARSGKSAFAEALCEDSPRNLVYVATSPRFEGDPEMTERIALHQSRRGERWTLVEEQLDLNSVLTAHNQPGTAILIDCMTLWLNNLMFHGRDVSDATRALVERLPSVTAQVLFISNEVGQGIVPIDADTRAFRDAQGRLNQSLATACDRVIEVRIGQPLLLKPSQTPPITL